MRRSFVAKGHLCWFSKKLDYNKRTLGNVFNIDPEYILWCYENLKHLRFATGIENQIKKYRAKKLITQP